MPWSCAAKKRSPEILIRPAWNISIGGSVPVASRRRFRAVEVSVVLGLASGAAVVVRHLPAARTMNQVAKTSPASSVTRHSITVSGMSARGLSWAGIRRKISRIVSARKGGVAAVRRSGFGVRRASLVRKTVSTNGGYSGPGQGLR